jgi:hypothetical protein
MVETGSTFFDFLEGDGWKPVEAAQSHRRISTTGKVTGEYATRNTSISARSSRKTSMESSYSKKSNTAKRPLSSSSIGRRTRPSRSKMSSTYQLPGPSSSCDDGSPSCGSDPANRTNHNLIERKYRNRLNEQFETLLSALPASRGNNQNKDEEFRAKRISKAEVLILAKERIEALERERGKLEFERCKLREDLDMLTLTYGTTTNFPS